MAQLDGILRRIFQSKMKRFLEDSEESSSKRQKCNNQDYDKDGIRRYEKDHINMKNILRTKITKTGDDRSLPHYELIAKALANELPDEKDLILELMYRWYVPFVYI